MIKVDIEKQVHLIEKALEEDLYTGISKKYARVLLDRITELEDKLKKAMSHASENITALESELSQKSQLIESQSFELEMRYKRICRLEEVHLNLINELAAANKLIADSREQEIYAWASLNGEDFSYSEYYIKTFVGHGWIPLYAHPLIPAELEAIGFIDESDDDVTGGEYFVQFYPDKSFNLGDKVYVKQPQGDKHE